MSKMCIHDDSVVFFNKDCPICEMENEVESFGDSIVRFRDLVKEKETELDAAKKSLEAMTIQCNAAIRAGHEQASTIRDLEVKAANRDATINQLEQALHSIRPHMPN